MSFDLSIWRRSPTTKTAMIVEVDSVVGVDGADHPAAGVFDTSEFVRAVVRKLGRPASDRAARTIGAVMTKFWPRRSSPSEVTWVEVSDSAGERVGVSLWAWQGSTSSIVRVSGPVDWKQPTIDALLELVVARDLVLYDPQEQAVFNNRRSYS